MFEHRLLPTLKLGRPRKLLYGVGVNDAPYIIAYIGDDGKERRCPFYQKWKSLVERVASPKFKEKYSTYADCSIDPTWLNFMTFRKWMVEQDWVGKDLDKDLLIQGNKHYGPNNCVFIPQALNKLLCLRGNARGKLPLGVSYTTINEKRYITAYCSFYGKSKNLGYFDSIDAAAVAYKKAKLLHIAELAANETDQRIKQALLRLY